MKDHENGLKDGNLKDVNLENRRFNPIILAACQFGGIASIALAIIYIINNFITYGIGGSGVLAAIKAPLESSIGGFIQVSLPIIAIIIAFIYTKKPKPLRVDAARLDYLSAYIIRVAFWGALMVGITDAVISFIRVEGLHQALFGNDIAIALGQSSWRGAFVHIPLLIAAIFIAMRDRSVSFIWLTLMVVMAELLIVIARFIFGYEQTFMGDLVRFWYAALFLFASAQTLKEEAHVRVDVIFAGFKEKRKAWLNATGTIAFGMPLCWLIIILGLGSKSSVINSPLLNFETSMSGFGMYVKYLMAAFLIVFALSMLVQFTSYLFSALAIINGDDDQRNKVQ